MNHKTLVLNQDYSPLTVCTVQRAFVLVYLKKVEMIQPHELIKLHSVSSTFMAPAVVRVTKYVHVPYKGVALTRQNIFRRDHHRCQYCGTEKHLTLDHVLPRARGGKTSWNNLVTACKHCNARKGDRLPEEAGMPLKSPPVRPSFVIFLRDYSGISYEEWQPFLQTKRMAG